MPDSNRSNAPSNLKVIATALFVAVEIVLLAALAYSFGVSYTERQLRAEQNTQQYPETTDERIARTCANMVGATLIKCVQHEVNASKEHERSEYDLSAQQDMSQWAYWLLWVSIGGIAVSVLALFLIWRTFLVTGETLAATQQMAIDTREIGEAQVRAYLAFRIKDVEIIPPAILLKDGEWSNLPATVSISGELHNSGQSPARRMKCRYEIQSVPKDSTIEVDARKLAATSPPSAQIIASGECTNQVFRRRLPVNWAALMAGNEHIWFMFALSYEDAFGNTIDGPASAGHIDGVSKLVARDAGMQAEQSVTLRFVWNQIESETAYYYDDGE